MSAVGARLCRPLANYINTADDTDDETSPDVYLMRLKSYLTWSTEFVGATDR